MKTFSRKFIAMLLVGALLFLSSCKSDGSDKTNNSSDIKENISSSVTSKEVESDKSESEKAESQKPTGSTSSKKQSESKKETTPVKKPSSTDKTETNLKPVTPPSGSGSGNNTSSSVPAPPAISLPGNDASSSSTVETQSFAYYLGGSLVNWLEKDNIVYSIVQNPNLLCVFSTQELKINAYALPAVPAEIRNYGNMLYISYPSLNKIMIYDISSFEIVGTIDELSAVSSFCLNGDILYYSEHDQHCAVFRKNLTNGQVDQIKAPSSHSFYYPKLELNREKGLLYIGECGSTGSKLYYFNTSDLSLNSVFSYQNYGYKNDVRTMYVYGSSVYWGEFKLKDTDATQVLAQFSSSTNSSVSFANDDIVCTSAGIYDAKSYVMLVDYAEQGLAASKPSVLISKSNSLVLYIEKYNSQDIHAVSCTKMQ